MHWEEMLASRQLILVTGKGGVGKSVVAAALALRAKAMGLRPLLLECDAPIRPSLFPGGRPSTTEVSEVVSGIFAINQETDAAIRDYAAASLPSKFLAEMIVDNRISRIFLQAAPSVFEMSFAGRMVQLAEQYGNDGPVIVDLHATGHALSLLRAPDGIMRVLRGVGPVYERASVVKQALYDPKRTAIVTVAVPEELPVTELLELYDALGQLGAPRGPVVLNSYFSGFSHAPADAIAAWQNAHGNAAAPAQDLAVLRAWSVRAEREATRLRDELQQRRASSAIALPYFFEVPRGETVAGLLSGALRGVG